MDYKVVAVRISPPTEISMPNDEDRYRPAICFSIQEMALQSSPDSSKNAVIRVG